MSQRLYTISSEKTPLGQLTGVIRHIVTTNAVKDSSPSITTDKERQVITVDLGQMRDENRDRVRSALSLTMKKVGMKITTTDPDGPIVDFSSADDFPLTEDETDYDITRDELAPSI